jgi:hypothetical protein
MQISRRLKLNPKFKQQALSNNQQQVQGKKEVPAEERNGKTRTAMATP